MCEVVENKTVNRESEKVMEYDFDCNKCTDKLCRSCDKPFNEREIEKDLRFFEHIICLFTALGLVCGIWAAVWYFSTK